MNVLTAGSILSIIFAFIATCLLATFPGWHEEVDENGSERDVKPFPSKAAVRVVLVSELMACILAFMSAVWQHVAAIAFSAALGLLSADTLSNRVGAAGMVFGWLGSISLLVGTIGILFLDIYLRSLDQLTDEGNEPHGDGDE